MSDSPKVSAQTICNEFSDLISLSHGESERTATTVCSQTEPKENALVFVSDPKHFATLLESPVSIIVTSDKLAAGAKPNGKTILATKNVYLAMAMINKKFFPLPFLFQPFGGERVHKTALVHPSAKVSSTAILSPGVVVNSGSVIGERVFVGANTVIESNTTIGDDTILHPQVYIGHSVRMGKRCEVKPNSTVGSDGFGYAHDAKGNHYRLPHAGLTIIEDDVHIGANVNIDRGTYDRSQIGAGTKIDNHCHFAHNVIVGKNCLITAGFISAGSTTIGDNCVFGGRSSVNGHINITNGCTFGGMSVVTGHVTKPGMYAGFPLTDYKESLRVNASALKVPLLRRQVKKIMKHLGLEDETGSAE